MYSILSRVDPAILDDVILDFPDPREADEYGLLGLSSSINPGSLLKAYSKGIFPWPFEESCIPWTAPWRRGVIYPGGRPLPRRDLRYYFKACGGEGALYRVSLNENFSSVIDKCAALRNEKGEGTWITDKLSKAYVDLHNHGFAYSVEVWDAASLVGGLYGVCIAGVVSAESMFNLTDNAGKFALIFLLEHLAQKGVDLLDIQMVTQLTGRYGGVEISQNQFNSFVDSAQRLPLTFSGLNPPWCRTEFDKTVYSNCLK